MISVVQKPFEASKVKLKPGTVVDSSGWPLEARLLNTRFLRQASPEEAATLKGKHQPVFKGKSQEAQHG